MNDHGLIAITGLQIKQKKGAPDGTPRFQFLKWNNQVLSLNTDLAEFSQHVIKWLVNKADIFNPGI